jgi:hypothetical protein
MGEGPLQPVGTGRESADQKGQLEKAQRRERKKSGKTTTADVLSQER